MIAAATRFRQTLWLRLLVAGSVCWCCVEHSTAATIEGFTEPYRQVDVAAGAPGVLAEIFVQAGDPVVRGQLLASLDTSVLDAALAVAQARAASTGELETARIELELRQERLTQIRLLHQRGHSNERELSRAEADLRIADARQRMATEARRVQELECRQIEAQIERMRVRSPIDGIVAATPLEVGEAVAGNSTAVMTLAQLSRLRVRYPASPAEASQFQDGQRVELVLPDFQEKLEAVVERIGALIDARSGTLELHLVVSNPDLRYRSGARCLLPVAHPASSPGVGLLGLEARPTPKY